MFTEVERSKLEAEASLERARGEQASLRVLSNAARLIKDNPALANLRFLHTLEQAPGAKTIVLGSDAIVPFTGKGAFKTVQAPHGKCGISVQVAAEPHRQFQET